MKFILASASPRRKDFIAEIVTADKLIISPDNVEEVYSSVRAQDIVKELSILKGVNKSKEFSKDFVVSSDTIVYFNGEVLGKPKNREDAINMLEKLSGNKHSVFSGVAIFYNGKIETMVEESIVEFYQLDKKEILKYVDSKEPFDKAGAYGIQGYAKLFVKNITGSYSNIVGFPIAQFYNKYKDIIREINDEKQ